MRVVFLSAVQEHLDSIFHFLSNKSKQAAINVFNDILSEIERLEQFPNLGKIEPVLKHRPQSFRSLVVGYYKVIYFVDTENEIVYIAAVWDCRRNPKTNKEQIK